MANHALPTTSSLYTDVLTNLKDRIDDSLKMLDSVNTSPTNTPTNAIRWNSTTTLWEKYSGSAWGSLAASYAIQVLKSSNLVGGNNTTLLGSIPYQSNTDTSTLLAPNTTTTRKFLRQTGSGTNGSAPAWDTILAADVPTLNQNTTGNAGTATALQTAITIAISGDATGTATSFNGSANIAIPVTLGTVPVAKGGTGVTTSTGTGSVVLSTSPTFTGTVVLPSTTSIGTITNTELSYIDGVTSSIQTQFTGKQATLVSGTNIKTINSNSILGSGNLVVGETAWTANDTRAKTALNATGTAPIYACRAWVNFNGTGTVAIRASGNVSSITDNGVGDYTVNFTTAMPDVAYGFSLSTDNTGTTAPNISTNGSILSSSIRIACANNTGLKNDNANNSVIIFR